MVLDKSVRARNLDIHIEDDCMFSSTISVVTGDSHSVVDLNGKRQNASKNIWIGDHVWVGNTVKITKGVAIQNNSIIGVGSIVTRRFEEENVAIAGNPAAVIKRNISWNRIRIPMEE